jgi:hypothetical protein
LSNVFFPRQNVSVGIRIAFYSTQNGSVGIRKDLFSKLKNDFDELRKNFMFNKTVLMDYKRFLFQFLLNQKGSVV